MLRTTLTKLPAILIGLLFTAIVLVSCEKEITVNFPSGEPVVVIEGYIENGQPPYVFLTNTIPFLGNISAAEYMKYFISGAVITVFDGTTTDTLREYKTPQGITVYSLDTANIFQSAKLLGKVGKTYTLVVKTDGRSFTASTTIQPIIPLDSIWVLPKKSDTNLVKLNCRLNEPAATTNYYRGFTRRNQDRLFDTGFRSVYNDIIVNGKRFDFTLDRGKTDFENNDTADFDKYGFFDRGDTIYVKWCSIDKAQFDFWSTFDAQSGSISNPFAAPLKIKTNIQGKNCTGVWASYGAFLDTIIVKK